MKPGRKLVEEGSPALTEVELLALLIGSGGKGYSAEDVARDILEKFGSLADLMGANLRELADVRGVGVVKAIRIAASYELTARVIKYLEQNG